METIKEKLQALLLESENDLEKYVINDLLDEEDTEQYLKDVLTHGCQSGTVNSLIYYNQTKDFFIKYIEEIDELREEMEENTGQPLEIGTPLYNWLAWFGYEETARKVADKLQIEI